MRCISNSTFFEVAESKKEENSGADLSPPSKKKTENNDTSSRSLAALALAALASALALAVTVASAQPTSVAGLIQQIPVVGTTIKPCPPVGFDSLPNFNLTAYVSAPWYIQQQVRFERGKRRERAGTK